ncbi:MAG: hypothetical protein JWQ16_1075 [Novosphingobium sp.]|nr:hypothetical protein [Novosphingobium sp.]
MISIAPTPPLVLPGLVRELALRLGAEETGPANTARLAQRGWMQNVPSSRKLAFRDMSAVILQASQLAGYRSDRAVE